MNCRKTFVAVFAHLLCFSLVSAQTLESVFSSAKEISYKGYKVSTYYDSKNQVSMAVIRKGSRVLARMKQDNNHIDMTRIGLFSFLDKKTKQIIIQQSTGGAHCCYLWRIYDLFPVFRLAFDSRRYPIGDAMDDAVLLDIDKDGMLEFIHYSNMFSYFDDYCFTCLPRPVVVFRYNLEAKQYFPANHIFPAYSLKGVKKSIEQVKEMDRQQRDIFPPMLEVLLSYIYSGREKQAWAFYNQYYNSQYGRTLKRKIKSALRRDGIYRFLYVSRQTPG